MNDDEVRRRLRQIERACARDDPLWTARMRLYAVPGNRGRWRRLSVALMGCVLVAIGATASVFSVFFLGALVLTVGVCERMNASRKREER